MVGRDDRKLAGELPFARELPFACPILLDVSPAETETADRPVKERCCTYESTVCVCVSTGEASASKVWWGFFYGKETKA